MFGEVTGTIKENDKAQELLLCRGPQGAGNRKPLPAWLGGEEEQGMPGGGVPEAALVSGEPKLEGPGRGQWCMLMTAALGKVTGFPVQGQPEIQCMPVSK